jgi:hypothetical protein
MKNFVMYSIPLMLTLWSYQRAEYMVRMGGGETKNTQGFGEDWTGLVSVLMAS